jgi:16S rRNA (cytosine967-C5)-methyltransferase
MPSSPDPSTAHLLAAAARTVAEVAHNGRALDDALQRHASKGGISRAALQALSFGTLRWHPRLAAWIEMLASRPVASMDPLVHALLAVGLHQLSFSRHPDHAIGNAVVEAARVLGQPRAAGFVNAVLRGFLRGRDSLNQRAMDQPEGRFAHPLWLIEAIRADWPQDWQQILDANNEAPPMWLRVNRSQGTVGDYLKLLAEQGIEASASELTPDGILLAQPTDVTALPGFETGRVSVQDAGAQLAAVLLEAGPGMSVLDACAAPGGKACHVLERSRDLRELVAVDRSRGRLRQVEENFTRIGAAGRVRIVAGDAGRPKEWLPADLEGGGMFDRMLLDVPCSATGVIRRHPDIKLLRRPSDIAALADEQLRLLHGLWPVLAKGGRLLYASCSVLRAENSEVVNAFLRQEPSARERVLASTTPTIKRLKGEPGVQLLPAAAGPDGFYYACLEKD